MICIICNGKGTVERDQVETCDNCEGTGQIITEHQVHGNDCKTGECG